MSKENNVVKTSFLASYAKYRSNNIDYWKKNDLIRGEMTRTKPLFKDEYLAYFGSDEVAHSLSPDADLRQVVHTIDKINSLIFPMFSVRHRYINKQLANTIKNINLKETKDMQVIILGAGFDTRAANKRKYSVKFFEVDQPSLLKLKKQIYEAKKIDPNAVYVGIDYIKENLIDSLAKHRIDFNKPTHIIWEGNIAYLPIQLAENILISLKDNFKGGLSITFDYYSTQIYQKSTGHKDWTALVETLEAMNAPFRSGIDDIQEFAKKLGMVVKNNCNGADLLIKYGIDTLPDEKLKNYSMCTLEAASTISPVFNPRNPQ